MGALITSTTMATITSAGNASFQAIPWLNFAWSLGIGVFVGYVVMVYVSKHS